MTSINNLIGTWRVVSFTRFNKDGVAGQPLGAEPTGYAVFDATGHAFIQLGRSPNDGGFPDEIAKSLMCYFGPYSVSGDKVSVTVESSNMADYLGSVQERKFEVAGDTMTIGTPGKYQAKLSRVL
ncbi:lipocalin-like domain-containing protein [Dongia sp. agr-C8]